MQAAGLVVLIGLGGLVLGGCGGEEEPAEPTPTAVVAGCAACHADASEGPGGVHGALTCDLCHLGGPGADDEVEAHAGMELEAGALDTVGRTCGRAECHAREAERVLGSTMATGRGLVAVDRWFFGELLHPDGEQTIGDVLATSAPSPGEDHLRRLCLGCHLGTRRDNRDDAVTGAGSGCSACHSLSHPGPGRPHPAIAGVPVDGFCFGCHSRSGRISLSYGGLAEVRGAGLQGCEVTQELPDGRTACRQERDLHNAAGLACVDCHLHSELMGDGTSWSHQERATEITCQACHGPGASQTTWSAVDDPITTSILGLHKEPRRPEEQVRLGERGTPLWNLRPASELVPTATGQSSDPPEGWILLRKLDGSQLPVPQTSDGPHHALKGHERVTCDACHAAWAPACADCHTRFEPEGEQWDFGAAAVRPGAWVETAEHFGVAPPALAVHGDRIVPAMPGMVARLELDPPTDHRLYARAAPHTTGPGRSCASCHAEPWSLGLGAGALSIEQGAVDPEVVFVPATPLEGRQTLPPDAWVQLFPPRPGQGTRSDLRSLDATEQRRLLQVAACLPCHAAANDPVYADFSASLQRRRAGDKSCAADGR